ncbi:MAG TPA: ATP-dependent DNA helicase RecQ, partial [Hyphomonas sp.]|nr:ATP-dependent DNA helicase RecQ [Hyphomonas sp.]
LKGESAVQIVVPPKRRRGRRGDMTPNPVGDPLFEALRALRKELAEDAQVPPYVIFHDRTLAEIARERPADADELRLISGVGEKKAQRYAEDVSRIVGEAA